MFFSHSVVSTLCTPRTAACQASQSFTISQRLLRLMSIESVMPSNHIILCQPLLLLPSIFPSIRLFSNESVLHIRWPKYCSFSISPSNEYSGLISFRIDWFDLLLILFHLIVAEQFTLRRSILSSVTSFRSNNLIYLYHKADGTDISPILQNSRPRHGILTDLPKIT